VWSRCDALQVFTERDAAAVAELAPELSDRVRVNPFAIELPLLDAHVGDNEDTMLFAGNYTHPPNVDAALWLAEEIVPRVVALRPGAKLLLAGPYAPPAVRALNGPAVRFLGQVDDLDPLLRRAAVVMAPVRTGGGMRMKVLHALAHGKAVVTTPRGAEGLIGAGDPPLAVAHDAQGLADAAARLLADPASRRELGARARAYAQEFHSPQAHRARLEAAIADAVGRVRSGP
jgi:glycosyltransferase involved in cell wall biosynthesis